VAYFESCVCCQSLAPSPASPEHADWYVLIGRDGAYLGVACVGCVADEELLVAELEAELAEQAPLLTARRGAAARTRGSRRRRDARPARPRARASSRVA
jgi:hypothetical protein